MTDQYLRKVNLVVASGGSGLDLSQQRISWRTVQSDVQTPNHAIIRIYNLAQQTAASIQKEFERVVLQAGYEAGNFGVIFDGTIKQVRRGRVSGTDTYLDILAADGDRAYNFGVVNNTIKSGRTLNDQLDSAVAGLGIPKGYVPDLPPGALSRGKVQYGNARDEMSIIANSSTASWSIQNGEVQIVKDTGYVPGEAVVINATSGMIGLPEQTEGGIYVRVLLNPNIKIGTLVQIDNSSIQRAFLGGVLLNAPGRLENLPGFLPKVTDDGFYKVYVNETVGDTRDTPFYSSLTCLAVDRSTSPGTSVQAAG